MKSVKRILTLLVVLAMVFVGAVALVACKPDDKNGDNPGDIPTEDGKVTLYWTVENTTELTNITSYYLCGTPNGWTEGDATYELKQVAGTKTFYTFMDPTLATGAEYKVLIGYNSNSPVDASNQGPFWSNEGYGKTWAAGGANSKVPDFAADAKTVDCGTIEFDGCLGEPIPVKNFDVRVSFPKGQLGENAVVFIMGHFSSWANKVSDTKIKAVRETSVTTLDTWKIHVDQMYAKEEAEYLVVVFPEGLSGITPVVDDDKSPNNGQPLPSADIANATVWNYFNAKNSGGIKICDNDDNAKTAITAVYENDYVDIANTVSEGTHPKAVDLDWKVENTKENEDKTVENLGNYNLDMYSREKTSVTFQVKFSAPVAANLHVYLAGMMEGWTGTEMTASADRKTFTVTVEITNKDLDTNLLATDGIQYKVVVSANAFSWDDNTRIDIGCEGDSDGGSTVLVQQGAKNFGQKFTSAEGTLELFGGAEITLLAAE